MAKIARSALVLILVALCPAPAFAEIVRFIEVAPGIWRGSQPEDRKDYDALEARQIRTVVNLRNEPRNIDAERAEAQRRGWNFVSVPLEGFKRPADSEMRRLLSTLTSRAAQPVFVHCHYGKDRTGLAIGLYRVLYEGWTQDHAYQEMLSLGFNELLLPLKNYFWNNGLTPSRSALGLAPQSIEAEAAFAGE